MDNNYRANVSKWLPRAPTTLEKSFSELWALSETMASLARNIAALLTKASGTDFSYQNDFKNLIRELEHFIPEHRMLSKITEIHNSAFKYKFHYLTFRLKKDVNNVARFTRRLIEETANCTNNDFLRMIFRLVNVYNDLLSLDHEVSDPSINIFYNDCPNVLEPLKKISVTRILQLFAKLYKLAKIRQVNFQLEKKDFLNLLTKLAMKDTQKRMHEILANNRAEEYCHELIDCLLTNYRSSSDKEDARFVTCNDLDASENSSIEIYRTLTKNLTPPVHAMSAAPEAISNAESIQSLVDSQNEQVIRVLNVVKIISPYLLGSDATKLNNDEIKIRRNAVKRVSEFYQEVAWGSVSSILDHVVLWWSPEALAARHSHGSQHLKDWLQQFVQGHDVPPTVRPALQTLCDALGCHVTITAWDQLFRLAYTAAFDCQSKSSFELSENLGDMSRKGTDTGHKFLEVFHLLKSLSNECEMGGEWVVGAPLIELPLSEQIVVLHRMDHSVHTMRLWAMQEARMIAHTWELQVFFLIVKADILNCLQVLSYLKLADHTSDLEGQPISVQVYVCAKMRAKIVSEVTVNMQLLKDAPALCTKILAKIGRIVSLANLHMCFPKSNYWRKSLTVAPDSPSPYVEIYFERVLFPVLEVIEDSETSNMILRIMCEAWLDYIYLHKIKFSEWGALQLLKDFAHVLTWVTECSIISEDVRDHLLKNEVLRRCEGVGRLLLRHPGEAISMNKKIPHKTNENGSPESLGLERMPAEMYVPNQEQWLELRAKKRYNLCCTD